MSFGIPVRNGLGLGLTPSTTLSSGRTGPRPALTLNFLTSTALSSNVTFSRGTQATLTDSTGKITYAPNNLLTNSESFEASSWQKANVSVSANASVAPDGTTTADVITSSAAAGYIYPASSLFSAAGGGSFIASVYAKAGTATSFQILLAGAANYTGTFNLSTGVASTSTGNTSVSMVAVGNGWYRCAMVCTSVASIGYAELQIGRIASTLTLNLWGAQLEQVTYQTTPGTYNSTTPKNLLGYTQEFDNAAWTKSNSFVQTNLLTYSQDFDNAAWTKNAVAVSANSTAAPDGTLTADKLGSGTAASAYHQTYQIGKTITSGASITASAFLKAGDYIWGMVNLYDGADNAVFFNLSTGAIGTTPAGCTATIQDYGNGWYRCTVTKTAASASGGVSVEFSNANGVTSFAAPIGTGIYAYGAQIVQGATAGNYQPTYAAAAAVQYAAPNGTLSADKLVETTANSVHFAQTSATVVSGTTYVFSAYVKAAERNFVLIQSNYGNNVYGTINLTTGATNLLGGTGTLSAVSVGDGWWRVSIVAASSATSGLFNIYPATNSTTFSYTGDGTSGIYVWGAQLSNSASLDPYVYNPGAAPTSAAYYGPRFDYDPVTLAPKGLLIEEQRSNLATYSEQFDNAAWGLNAASATPNVTTAPNGTTSADKLVEGASTATHGLDAPAAAITAGTTYTGSLYAKASERRYLFVALTYSGFTSGNGVCFDLQTGTIVGSGTGSASAGAITPVGNGWYRCSITLAATVSGTFIGAPAVYLSDTATNSLKSYTGDGTSGAFVWGAQLEAGAFATSYIPTVASTVTRSADVASMLGTNFSSWYNQPQGTFVAEFSGRSGGYALNANDGTNNNATGIVYLTASTVRGITVVAATGRFVDMSGGATPAINKTAYAYKTNDLAGSTNGGAVVANATAAIPALTQLFVGAFSNFSYLNGHVRTLSYYNTRLTNTQLQALTA